MANSIMTNASAMTALKNLNMTNKNLEQTQGRISTGFRVAEASDNAAYWSIATTMRSDNKALSTVNDALGLGKATVDVAYTALESSKSVLDDIKAKLVAAKQPGVDKTKVQTEIAQLQKQLEGIASAASFSGSNWLSVDSSKAGYTATQQVVSSFSRDGAGTLSVGTIDIDVSKTALFDKSVSGMGLLEGGTSGAATSATFAWNKGTMVNGEKLTFAIKVDGAAAQNVQVTIADVNAFTLDNLVTGLNATLTGGKASAVGGKLVLTSDTNGTTSSMELTGVTNNQATTTTAATVGFTTIASASGANTGGGLLDIDISTATSADLDKFISRVDKMTEKVVKAASDLGAVKSRIGMQTDFVSNLMDAIDRGVGQLVDADMNEESTRLQALQVQQQLGVQALSLANGSAQSLLSLFRG